MNRRRKLSRTASLITVGVIFVLVFISVSGSFKNRIVGQITDSMLGHIQIHRQGYVASIDNLPLNLNIKGQGVRQLEALLKQQPEVVAYSPRLKFGGMFSTFVETTNIRLNVMIMAVYERIREIGTMAAIGTLPGKILSMFVLEGFCLGVLGTVVGNLVGGIILYLVNLSRISFEFGRQSGLILSVQFNPRDIVVVSLIVILVSILASLQPAFKASRMEPIKALRHV
jgi:ABC-type lipoprotein release transport system permease subunit